MTAEINKKLYHQGFGLQVERPRQGPLRDRYGFAPFSTINTREGVWQDRKRAWIRLGIQSEIGRSDDLTYSGAVDMKARYDQGAKVPSGRHEAYTDGHLRKKLGMRMSGTSIFDPVLCEVAYTWWGGLPGLGAPADAYAPIIVDPFAGGSVRGIVASILGGRYWGCELRANQVEGNIAQLGEGTLGRYRPKWVCGDSYETLPKGPPADFLFSCPPYGNLEVYSDDPSDISNKPYAVFLERYREIIRRACTLLRSGRFATWVVANYRDKSKGGGLVDLVGDTVRAFEDSGLTFYNEIILINSVGTGAMRANTNFDRGSRKVVKLHQNILVFLKGTEEEASRYLPKFWDEGEANV